VLFGLLGLVAGSAAVLSFAALRDLALLCGFSARLGWLLPVVVDAGAAAGSLVWLGGRSGDSARRFARTLALTLLGLSVGANALGHGLAAFRIAPPWWVVVAVSAIAPAVLGAVVHLAVLVSRTQHPATAPAAEPAGEDNPEPWAAQPWTAEPGTAELEHVPGGPGSGVEVRDHETAMARWRSTAVAVVETGPADTTDRGDADRAALLIAAGVGRRRLSRELGVSEYEARQLLARTRNHHDDEGTATEMSTEMSSNGTGTNRMDEAGAGGAATTSEEL
jgi:hypothetical protein